jgi:hypothetical protein
MWADIEKSNKRRKILASDGKIQAVKIQASLKK